MTDLKQLKTEVEQLNRQIEELSITDYNEVVRLKASRNSKARKYNREKKFWQLEIKMIY